jgi:hypothetical protein
MLSISANISESTARSSPILPNADKPQPNRSLKNAPTDRNNATDEEPVLA